MTAAQRETLILDHMPLVRRIAGKIKRRLPPCYDLVDLISMGTVGLIQAADKFNELAFSRPGFTTKIPFGAFARKRIQGEILEHCRKRRWEEETRPPIDLSAPKDARNIDGSTGTARDGQRPECHDTRPNAEQRSGHQAALRLISRAIAMLPDREKLVIELHYHAEKPIRAIAPGLHVVPSRVSQIHRSGLAHLKANSTLWPLKKAA